MHFQPDVWNCTTQVIYVYLGIHMDAHKKYQYEMHMHTYISTDK